MWSPCLLSSRSAFAPRAHPYSTHATSCLLFGPAVWVRKADTACLVAMCSVLEFARRCPQVLALTLPSVDDSKFGTVFSFNPGGWWQLSHVFCHAPGAPWQFHALLQLPWTIFMAGTVAPPGPLPKTGWTLPSPGVCQPLCCMQGSPLPSRWLST